MFVYVLTHPFSVFVFTHGFFEFMVWVCLGSEFRISLGDDTSLGAEESELWEDSLSLDALGV